MKNEFVVGSRKSLLAMCQSKLVIAALQKRFPNITFRIKEIVTQGDRNIKDSLQKIGGKGVFVKEIEANLQNGNIDFAVHSLKDVMPVLPEDLIIGAIPKRQSPYDCLITPKKVARLADLPQGARIGTNSLRRQGQLLHLRPDIQVIPIRGNVDTRIKKIKTEHLDGVILAESGLDRLQVSLDGLYRLSLKDDILPATGQGALAIECRKADADTLALLSTIDDATTKQNVQVERNFLRALGGSCNYPIGAFAESNGDQITFKGLVASPDGTHLFHKTTQGTVSDAIGGKTADTLIAEGALKLIESTLK
ncbi:hydroxymethylbilane synthase [Secundilactobacillus yichangensis]|uniref:hydroxymethylbilane synthase n=1 Tax=Secundilactobacillus yichangensis TaxID=2799580 RepID=UPI00194397F2|nr:hydroxymethylbilane synthase [Secundilactobacillus yichangensis]